MIVTRFRSVYWVGGVAVAALGCYLVSQRVAFERTTLARTEREIVSARRDIRALQTEIGTRAGMNQIERWNADVLSLSAPKAGQFVTSEVQLAALVQPVRPAMAAPAVIQVAVPLAPAAAPQVVRVSAPAAPMTQPTLPRVVRASLADADRAEKPAPIVRASFVAQPRKPAPKLAADDGDDNDTPRLRQAVYVRPGRDHQNVALLDDRLLGDLTRIAANERADGKRSR